jgi:hypothetical protein
MFKFKPLTFRDVTGRLVTIGSGWSIEALDAGYRPYPGIGPVAFYRITLIHSGLKFIATAADWKASGIQEQYND